MIAIELLTVATDLQAPLPKVDVEQIESLTGVIRWTGVAASVLVVAAAVLLLRVVDGVVGGMAERFAQWRMFLNKLRALFHFGLGVR